MARSSNISQSVFDKLRKIEKDYHEFLETQIKHYVWEHINFPDYAVNYHDFYSYEVADQYWRIMSRTKDKKLLTSKPHKLFDCPCTKCQEWYRDALRPTLSELEAEQQLRKIAELKNQGSFTNNLCSDHRDKQVGQSCLACTIERERKARKEAEQEYIDCRSTLKDERYCHGQTISQLKCAATEEIKAANQRATAAERKLAEVEKETIERCAKDWYALVPKTERYSVNVVDGILETDVNGPWVLRADVDSAIRALA